MSISINEVKSLRPNLIVSEVNDIGTLKVKSDLPTRSSNFGPGADLLMNSKIKKCRVCECKELINLVDLGKQPLANALLKNENEIKKEIRVPLILCICKKCKLIQLKHTVKPSILFKKYFWTTGTSKKVKIYRKYFFDKIMMDIF